LGHELGFYKVLGENISLTSDQLADLSNTNKRLTREWLDQQASSRLLSYDLDSDTYSMSAEGAEYLARPESATWLAGSLPTVRAAFLDMDLLIGAMKGDGGVGWGEHHECYFHGVTERFRPLYEHVLVQQFVPALRDKGAALVSGAMVADVGCGTGVSTRRMAAAYPKSQFTGIDYYAPSVALANENAKAEGLSNVRFEVASAQEFSGSFDLVCFFDCIHDLGDPVGAAERSKSQLNEGGSVFLIEPFAYNTRVENHSGRGENAYARSLFFCTPCSLSQDVGRALGNQAGEPGMRGVFEEARYAEFSRISETRADIAYQAFP
jgi:SAM-dependent methyltransferase